MSTTVAVLLVGFLLPGMSPVVELVVKIVVGVSVYGLSVWFIQRDDLAAGWGLFPPPSCGKLSDPGINQKNVTQRGRHRVSQRQEKSVFICGLCG